MRISIESSTSYRGRNSRPNLPALLAFLLLAFGAGAVGVAFSPLFSHDAALWFQALSKPRWLPPVRGLGPAWAGTYLLMGTAAWLVWRERYHQGRGPAIAAYAVQLLLNALWAPLFFALHNTGAGLFDAVALWLALAWTLREFGRVKSVAAWILIPYLAWVSLVSALSFQLWKLNP